MLADCIKKVMTNGKEPVRLNLESIDELRNTGTHLVVEEYEITYGPIFQANIHNTTTNSATGTASKYATAQAVAFIVDEISKNPQHVIQMKDKTKRMGK